MQSTKDKILSAVLSHIKEGENLGQITISKIANEAEIGKSTVYEHFSSKEDMILETYQFLLDHYDQILSAEAQQIDFKGAFIEQIKRLLFVMKDAKMIMSAIMNFDEESFLKYGKQLEGCTDGIREKMQIRFEVIIRQGIEEGIIQPRKPKEHIGNVIQAIISGLLFQYVNGAIDIDENSLYELIYQNTLVVIKD
ncbi:MAG: TetR/AcrR family transcriptional regulator [Acholeplasmataceae bacterium]|nr:TetR/AcrR family transcriptional regulator [Acholeplasmataceae bacterium]